MNDRDKTRLAALSAELTPAWLAFCADPNQNNMERVEYLQTSIRRCFAERVRLESSGHADLTVWISIEAWEAINGDGTYTGRHGVEHFGNEAMSHFGADAMVWAWLD